MGAYYRQALRAGIPDKEFWSSTPHAVRQRIKAQFEDQLSQAWWIARFAVEREPRLSGMNDYIRDLLDPVDPELARAQAEAVFTRMAADWGLEIEDVDLSGGAESA